MNDDLFVAMLAWGLCGWGIAIYLWSKLRNAITKDDLKPLHKALSELKNIK